MSNTLFDPSIYGLAEGETLLTKLSGLAGGSLQTAVGFALGFAASNALGPLATELEQVAWANLTVRALDAATAAQIVAEDVKQADWGASEAAQHGVNRDRFDAIVAEVLAAPGIGELLAMLRRGTITPDDFTHGLRKDKQEARWDVPLAELESERLDPAVIATSIQRGIIEDPGLLPVGPPTETGRVPPMPVSTLDPLKEAAASGIDKERLAALTRIVGLPPAPGELLQLVNRGVIGEVDYLRGIAEGNTRNEWGSFLLNLKRRLLTPHEYAELNLRGWITPAAMHAGAALSGLEAADADLLFSMLGRPLNVHAVTTGLARGGAYGGVYEGVPEPYAHALRQSNIRPEWGNLAYANRYNYPSAFVLRSLAQTGELKPADVEQTLLDIGWRPDFAAKVTAAWTAGTAAKADPHVTKAETQLWGALHKSYVDSEEDDATTTADLTTLGVAAASIPEVLRLWQLERAVIRRSLTPAQVKKAVGQPGKDHAWALARLAELGYTADDATAFLAE